MAGTFLGFAIAAPFYSVLRVQSASTVYSRTGKSRKTTRPDDHIEASFGLRPDAFGKSNLAGVIRAHQRKYGTDLPFTEVCPQDMGTLDSTQASRAVRGKTAEGTRVVTASGSVSGVKVGRFISFGTGRGQRLYGVEEVDTDNNRITLDMPLLADVANNTRINWNPTGSWLWTPGAVENPPATTRGVNAGIGWLAEIREHTG